MACRPLPPPRRPVGARASTCWRCAAADARPSPIRASRLLRAAIPRRSRWRRHVPIAALLARPRRAGAGVGAPRDHQDVPTQKTSIILALDESGSMCSTDVHPNRLEPWRRRGAREFVNSQPGGTQIGLVLFNVFAELAVAPTSDRGALDQRSLAT